MKLKNMMAFVTDPRARLSILASRGLLRLMPDEAYLRRVYRFRIGRPLNLRQPRAYTEKLQWLKLHDRNPLYPQLVDKFEVRRWVEERIGGEYLIPLVGGPWDSFDEINFDRLPDRFVLKCTHDSGGLVICRDKARFDRSAARRKISSCLKRNYFWVSREWPYRDLHPRIIAEAYVEDSATAELRDYKFFTFNGQAKALYVASDRAVAGEETKFDFFDMDFNHLDVRNDHPNAGTLPQQPAQFGLMRKLAEQLSAGLTHVRVDLYEADGRVYFGEMTFYHMSGTAPFEPDEWDYTFGSWLSLPEQTEL